MRCCVMRSVLIDHIRARQANKRGGGAQRVHMDAVDLAGADEDRRLDEMVQLDDALDSLAKRDPAAASVAEMVGGDAT